jgi:hypothetical protein
MADLIAFPYDSLLTDGDSGLELDRAIDASMYRRLMSKYFTTGVFPDDTDNAFKVLAFDKNIIVKKGSANINGVYAELEEDVTINITDYISSSNTVTLAVALRNDDTLSARKTTVQIVTNNTNQLVPPTRNSTVYEIYIAKVELEPNAITVYQSDITDLRLNTEYCGVVTATVKGVDTTTFYDQFQGALDRFLETVQSAIDGTTAGNLQNQINEYWKKIYPVGSIYMSINNTNPEILFGGTWTEWGKGRVPVGVNTADIEFNEVEKIGGKKEQVLRASIGAFGSDTSSIGYAHADPTPNHDVYQMAIHGTPDTTPRAANHATEVWQSDGTGPTTLQPYITCYMWKRVE